MYCLATWEMVHTPLARSGDMSAAMVGIIFNIPVVRLLVRVAFAILICLAVHDLWVTIGKRRD